MQLSILHLLLACFLLAPFVNGQCTPEVLTSGTRANKTVAAGSYNYYSFNFPADSSFYLKIVPTSGDPDLFGAQATNCPTLNGYTVRSSHSGLAAETIAIDNSGGLAGTYYFSVTSATACAYRLSLFACSTHNLTVNSRTAGYCSQGASINYKFHYMPSNTRFNVTVLPSSGDTDLYGSFDSCASPDLYNVFSEETGTVKDSFSVDNSGGYEGDMYVTVKCYTAALYGLVVTTGTDIPCLSNPNATSGTFACSLPAPPGAVCNATCPQGAVGNGTAVCQTTGIWSVTGTCPHTSNNTGNNSSSGTSLSTTTIAGLAGGGVALVLVAAGVCMCMRRKSGTGGGGAAKATTHMKAGRPNTNV